MTNTPLSDRISALVGSADPTMLGAFHSVFLESELGVFVDNPPTALSGGSVQAGPGITFSPVQVADGRMLVKACADPREFHRRYPGSFNVLIHGRELLTMTEKITGTHGVLVCSAASFHSVPIWRHEIGTLLSLGQGFS